jgi:hypothetical protein
MPSDCFLDSRVQASEFSLSPYKRCYWENTFGFQTRCGLPDLEHLDRSGSVLDLDHPAGDEREGLI